MDKEFNDDVFNVDLDIDALDFEDFSYTETTFDFSSEDKIQDGDITSKSNLQNLVDYNDNILNFNSDDLILNSNDTFAMESLNSKTYNKDTINTETPSEKNKNINDMNVNCNKNSHDVIDYRNKAYLNCKDEPTQSLHMDADVLPEKNFYELDIKDYPDRQIETHSNASNNKSLGINDDGNLITRLLNKIKSIISKQ